MTVCPLTTVPGRQSKIRYEFQQSRIFFNHRIRQQHLALPAAIPACSFVSWSIVSKRAVSSATTYAVVAAILVVAVQDDGGGGTVVLATTPACAAFHSSSVNDGGLMGCRA